MTVPDPQSPTQQSGSSGNNLLRAAIWVAIGALIAAAIVCVVWVLIGTQNGIVGRAFLTILLLAGFAGVAILDAHLAPRRPAWFALASMVTWVLTLLIGAVLIWLPERYSYGGFGRFVSFLLIVAILQLALLHVRLYVKAFLRHVTTFTRIVTYVTVALVVVLAFMLVVPLVLNEWVDFPELYWRIVVAITILAAVGTALIPLMNVLFAPKKPREFAAQTAGYAPAAWPTYADGVTPLPVLPDGSPDWNAYYTGYPSTPQAIAPAGEGWPAAEQQPWPVAGAEQQAWPAPGAEQQAWPAPGAEQQGWSAPAAAPAPAPEQTWNQQPAAPTPQQPAPETAAPGAPAPGAPAGYEGFPPPPPLPPRS